MLDQVIIAQSMTNVTGFVFPALALGFYFPGANLPLVFILGAIPAFSMGAMYGVLAAAIPRSGGDYMFTGRILGPRWAMIVAVMILVPGLSALLGQNVWLISGLGLAQLFTSLGLTTGNQGLVSFGVAIGQPPWGYVVSLISIGVILIVGIFGVDAYRRVMRYGYIWYAFASAVFAAAIVIAGSGSYASHFDAAMSSYNVTYSHVISTVSSNPQLATQMNIGASFLAMMPLGFLMYEGFNFMPYSAGECKNAPDTVPKSLLLAVLIGLVVTVGFASLSYTFLGGTFVNGMSYLFNSGQIALPVQPSINFLVSIAVPPWLGVLVNLVCTTGFFFVSLSLTIAYSRTFFAMAFDRVLPSKLADVSDRLHSPYVAVLAVTALDVIFTTVWWYTGWGGSYLNGTEGLNIAYLIPGIAAVVFPVLRKDAYKRLVKPLPGWLSAEIAGIPVVSLVGGITAIAWGFGIFSTLEPLWAYTYLGANLPIAIGQTILLAVAAVAIFEVSRAYHKRKDGFDLNQIFAEIPPE
jgi:amino acid transporter